MNDKDSEQGTPKDCPSEESSVSCCQISSDTGSSCCNTGNGIRGKWKALISGLIILAAIGVAAHSLVGGTSAQSDKTGPRSFSAALSEKLATSAVDLDKSRPLSQRQEMPLFQILDSLQTLDTLAADKDVVFIIVRGQEQKSSEIICKQVEPVLNKLRTSGHKIGEFTLSSTASDYDRLVRHFTIESFPCVLVMGRHGAASAVSDDISETRLYAAFALALKPVSCCPTQSSASCCPK
jgi:hypothetical protein